MSILRARLFSLMLFLFIIQTSVASPINCFEFEATTGGWTSSVKVTNRCGSAVELQRSELTFNSTQALSGSYWGDFGNLAYPEKTDIFSTPAGGTYSVRMPLVFPEGGNGWDPKTTIDNGRSIILKFSTTPQVVISNITMNGEGTPGPEPEPEFSKITFVTPINVTGSTGNPSVTVTNHNGYTKTLSDLNWNSTAALENIPYGEYDVLVDDITVGNDNWQGIATPAHVVLNSTAGNQVNITYQGVVKEMVRAHISGLPANSETEVMVQDGTGQQYIMNVGNGQHDLWRLPVMKTYQVTARTVTVDGQRYVATVNPNQFYLNEGQSIVLDIDFAQQVVTTKFSPYVDVTLGTITRWDSNTQSMQPLGLIDMARDSGVRSFHLAFITGQSGCRGTWAGYPVSTAQNGYGVPVFKQLKQQGVELVVALGGLSGQYLAQVCNSDAELKAAYDEIITAYAPDVLDFDVENSMQTNNAQLDRLMRVIHMIKAEHPEIYISFTLPVLPSGLVPGVGENVIARAAAGNLSGYGVNIMAMDYGSYFQQKTMGEYAIDALTNTFRQVKSYYPNESDEALWHQMEVTPMIGLNDTLPLNFSLADVATLKAFAAEKSIGLLSFWSMTRDHPCDSNYVSITCSSSNPATGLPNQQTDYEFARTFMND